MVEKDEEKKTIVKEIEEEEEEDNEDNLYTDNELTQCRMYRNELPDEGDLLYVEIHSMESAGAYVYLQEYDNVEAFLLYSEVSK
jgi:hypothetical protein